MGDNDTLAAEVAHLVDAELLIILSDIDGLFTEDPRKNPAAKLIPLIPDITKEIEQRAGVSGSFEGTGGMATKVRAAKKVSEYGVATLILNGQEAGLLPRVLGGGPGGSLFLAKERRFTSRKHWIAFTLRPRGTLALDPGAVEALARRGKSLLASGILEVSGPIRSGRCGQLSRSGWQRIRERTRELLVRPGHKDQRAQNNRNPAATRPAGV